MVADNPDEKIELKTFHCSIINDHAALKTEADNYKEIPVFGRLIVAWYSEIMRR
jgi:hypothetical protein